MQEMQKEAGGLNKSKAKVRVTREKCCKIKVKHGRVSKPKHVCLNDVMNYIENANRRETKIINSVLLEAAL